MADTNRTDLALAEAVHLVMRDNRNVKSAYLDRVVQKFDLKVANDKFVPNLDLVTSVKHAETDTQTDGATNETSKTRSDNGALQAAVTEKIPTGADFTFSWTGHYLKEQEADSYERNGTWAAAVKQPLLKGGGWEVNTASVRLADIQDEKNILSLKSTLISIVSETIDLYRSFLQNSEQVKISEMSLARAIRNQEETRALIKTGRLAANELIQAQSDVANHEQSLQNLLNDRDNSRLRLIYQLNMNKNVNLHPVEAINTVASEIDYANCLSVAFENRTDWLSVLLDIDMAEIVLQQARNNRLWDLSFTADYSTRNEDGSNADDRQEDAWQAGLVLTAPLYGDLSRKQWIVQAKTGLEQVRLKRDNLAEQIQVELLDRLRDIQSKEENIDLAIQARELAARKLSVEQEKLKRGRSTNFQVVSFQNDLLTAQNSELVAKIEYLNALNSLDQQLGTTLETWGIELNDER